MLSHTPEYFINLLTPVFLVIWIWIICNKETMIQVLDEILNSPLWSICSWLFYLMWSIIGLVSITDIYAIESLLIFIISVIAMIKWVGLIVLQKHLSKAFSILKKEIEYFLPLIGIWYCLTWIILFYFSFL